MRLLLIDNYDSFTFNLAQLFRGLGIAVTVHRHDGIDLSGIEALDPDWICISPGPRTPSHSGICKDVVLQFGGKRPVLGVCLGMQVINEAFGGRTVRASRPVHGKRAPVHHDGQGLFQGLPSPFQAARYHSLAIELDSPDLISQAHDEEGTIMAIRHRTLPIYGVQFHPESFLSQYGPDMAANFLRTDPAFESYGVPGPVRSERFQPAALGSEVPPYSGADKSS
jgi:anthranilate synthase component 2